MTAPTLTQLDPDTPDRSAGGWSPAVLANDRPIHPLLLVLTALLLALFYGLLWSPYYYPLSDSSLYLIVAKGLAAGRGLDYVRQIHRSIRPFTPLMFSWVIRAGGGVGAIHALLITLMLVSFALMFATVSRWLNQRIAYCVTILTALSWWAFSNAFTVMTEPAFLVFAWSSLLVLSYVKDAPVRWRWLLVLVGAILFAGAWTNRVAAILLLPGIVLALLITGRRVAGFGERAGWVAIFGVIGLLLALDYYHKPPPPAPGQNQGLEISSKGGIADAAEGESSQATESGYRWNLMVGVSNPLIQLPTNGGRWALETLAAALVYPFNSKSTPILLLGSAMGLATLLILALGAVRLARDGHWWPVLLLAYFLPLWLMWGTRVKARYMIPVAPAIFVLLWAGASVAIGRLLRSRLGQSRAHRTGAVIGVVAMLAISVPLNGFAWGVEVYLRHNHRAQFYDLARRGAFAELIDICAYLRKNTPPGTEVWLNRGASRRIVKLLCDRDVFTVKHEVGLTSPDDANQFAKLVPHVKGDYLVALYEKDRWPQFHWPLATPPAPGSPPRFWQLFKVDQVNNTITPVAVPRDRELLSLKPDATTDVVR